MKFKLSDLANIAEIVGAFAVVVSLVYVGIQVTDNTRAMRSDTASATSTAISAWYGELGGNLQASTIMLNGLSNPDSLSREEMAQFIFLVHGLLLQYQYAHYLSQEKTLDTGLQQSLTYNLLGVREQPGFVLFWQQRRNVFEPVFRQFVDDLIESGATDESFEKLYEKRDRE